VIWLRKTLILTHRYLGIALSLVFAMWFISGIAMIYAKDMPRLTPEERLARRDAIDFSRVRLSPAEAADGAGLFNPGGAVLVTIMGRPAYRLAGTTVFADTGERMPELGAAEALAVASGFLDVPESALRHEGLMVETDQWTLQHSGQLPLHKVVVSATQDGAGTVLYISPRLGEVIVMTTRGTRALAWVAAIPHWLYFKSLRASGRLWRQVVLGLSGLGALAVFIGLVLASLQFAPRRPLRWSRLGSYIPYAGWLRWHYVTGVVFGVFTLTWVVSGMLSMEPFNWASEEGAGYGIYETLGGGPLDLAPFPTFDATAWDALLPAGAIKEVDFVRIQGDPYYVIPNAAREPILVTVDPLRLKGEPFSIDSLMTRVRDGSAGVPLVDYEVLDAYDSYYYAQDADAPLPVLRVKFGDPDATWFYIDPATSQVVSSITERRRLERWIYHGFHSLDFPFWYASRPLWDIGTIGLALGGLLLSLIGAVLGMKRSKNAILQLFYSLYR
jgi:uncharacterized iron-regulated membrane protein